MKEGGLYICNNSHKCSDEKCQHRFQHAHEDGGHCFDPCPGRHGAVGGSTCVPVDQTACINRSACNREFCQSGTHCYKPIHSFAPKMIVVDRDLLIKQLVSVYNELEEKPGVYFVNFICSGVLDPSGKLLDVVYEAAKLTGEDATLSGNQATLLINVYCGYDRAANNPHTVDKDLKRLADLSLIARSASGDFEWMLTLKGNNKVSEMLKLNKESK